MAQNGASMAQNSAKLEAKTEPRRPKTVLRTKVAFRTALGELRCNVWNAFFRFWGRLGLQVGPKLEAKTEPKTTKNRCKNRSQFWCLLGSPLGPFLVDFGRQNGAKLAPKWHPKWILSCKRLKSKKHLKTIGISIIFEFSGVEVGTKNRSKSI